MDVELRTHTADPSLALRRVERSSDGSSYRCLLSVRSGGFGAEQDFCFDRRTLDAFLDALAEMNRVLTGAARLQPTYEPDYFELRMESLGRVLVHGELFEHAPESQHLRFAFATDQTVLGPLIASLGKL